MLFRLIIKRDNNSIHKIHDFEIDMENDILDKLINKIETLREESKFKLCDVVFKKKRR